MWRWVSAGAASAAGLAGDGADCEYRELGAVIDHRPDVASWKRLMRSQQQMTWAKCFESYGRDRAYWEDKLDQAERDNPGRLHRDPDLVVPAYACQDIHLQPGGYCRDELAGYVFHHGTRVFYQGENDRDEHHALYASLLREPADGQLRRIVDLGCSIGQGTTALKQRFPDADIVGVDIGLPLLRYAHLRATELGVDVEFQHALAEALPFDDGSQDAVFAFILFHEVPACSFGEIVAEAYRVLRPGGTFTVIGRTEQSQPAGAEPDVAGVRCPVQLRAVLAGLRCQRFSRDPDGRRIQRYRATADADVPVADDGREASLITAMTIASKDAVPESEPAVVTALADLIERGVATRDVAVREAAATDVYRAGRTPAAVVYPTSTDEVVEVVRTAQACGAALHVRGGGMSYTDAFLPLADDALLVDMSRCNAIREINANDLYATVEAGCTWAALDAALEPHGLRATFWGPMSGRLSTVGGAMAQGAVTFGSARNGPSVANVLGLEVVLADGTLVTTGSAGQPGHSAFYREYGPDLTGLLCNDAGAFGIKTAVTIPLEPRPACGAGMSFSFDSFDALVEATRLISREQLATEVFGAETALVKAVAGTPDLRNDLKQLWTMMRAAGSVPAALATAWTAATNGRRFLDRSRYLANFLVEAASPRELALVSARLRRYALADGVEVANTVAEFTRAVPFPDPAVIGPEGRRLLPLHGVIPYSKAGALHSDYMQYLESIRAECDALGVEVYIVYATTGRNGFLYECVIYWPDEWLASHRDTLTDEQKAMFSEPAPNAAARDKVEEIRQRTVEIFYEHGCVHFQIGRAYPYARDRDAGGPAVARERTSGRGPGRSNQPGSARPVTTIAIAGAGIGGLCAAVGLARAGRPVTVFEQAPELGDVGAGISLAPNAVKGLRHLGLEAAVEAAADEPLEQFTRHYATGEPLVTIDRHNTRHQFGAGYLQMHRADLHALLVAALNEAQPGAVQLNHRLDGVQAADDGAVLAFTNGAEVHVDLLIGADGLRSIVRDKVFAARGGEYAGVVAWRGLVPTDAFGDYELPAGSSVFVGPERIFVRYPVRHGTVQNFVAFTREPNWAAEGWTQRGDAAALRQHFEDFHDEVLRTIDAMGADDCFRWGLFERKPLERWVRGPVALLGDAAHPMLPWFGQGAATAIEDGVVLARSLTEAPDISTGLGWYERARRERVTEIHHESSLGGERLLNAYKTLLQTEPVRTEDTLGMTLYDPGTVALA